MDIPYCPHTPTEQQKSWLVNRDRSYSYIALAGAGKTEALLMAALQDAEVPGYSAIIFYRNPESVRFWLDLLDRWWEDSPGFRYRGFGSWLLPHGAQLRLETMPTIGRINRYRSFEWNFIGFDSVQGYTESQRKMEEWLPIRARGNGVRLRATIDGYSDYLADNPFVDHGEG